MKCRVLKKGLCEITQNFGNEGHSGVDVVGENYTLDKVVAHSNGVVIECKTDRVNSKGSTGNLSYGNYVIINHQNGFKTLYAHLDTVLVKEGDNVKAGKILGAMGDTGNAYGKHLHFEVYHNDIRINPEVYLDKDFELTEKTTDELANEVIQGLWGNGEERKEKLGDRYREVQDRVNELLATPEEVKDDPILLKLVRSTIRGDYGNGETRKAYLGGRYQEVQEQVNKNIADGNFNWDSVHLY